MRIEIIPNHIHVNSTKEAVFCTLIMNWNPIWNKSISITKEEQKDIQLILKAAIARAEKEINSKNR